MISSPQKSESPRWLKAAGFTLLEVLIVVGIVMILAAFLMPFGKSMVDRASRTKCSSNLRQLFLAVQNYAQDHNNQIIYGRGKRTGGNSMDWAPELAFNGYIGGVDATVGSVGSIDQVAKIPIFRCPVSEANRRRIGGAATQYTYGFNAHLSDAENPSGTKTFAMLVRPSQTMMIADGNGTTGWYLNSAKLPNAEHDKKANVLFCDGHVDLLDPAKFPVRGSNEEGNIFWNGVL